MFWKRFFIGYLIVLIITLTPAWASIKLSPDKFEVDGEVIGEAVSEAQLDKSRGTYLGVSFSVLFEGYWDTLGNYNANLITNGTGTGSSSLGSALNTLPPNTAVQIQATVGGFGAAKGIFQITQVPGSGNIVSNTLVINIQIIQVMGTTAGSLLTKF